MTKLDMAISMVPSEIAQVLILFGVDQAFIWTGVRPKDEFVFYLELGRKLRAMEDKIQEQLEK